MTKTKRPFDKLTNAEKLALEKVYENSCRPIPRCSTGLGELAQILTGDRTLRASSQEAQVYIQLGQEGWIVRNSSPARQGLGIYSVAKEYPALQLAS